MRRLGDVAVTGAAGGLRGRYGVLEFYPRVSYFAEWILGTTAADSE